MGKLAVLFPGQGAQQVGMMADFYESSAAVREIFDRADEVLGFGLKDICFNGPQECLDATDVAQPAIFVASAAVWAAVQEAGLAERLSPAATGGLSLGEYTALYLAGVIGFDDALRLVRARGQFMQEAAEAVPSGMVSVIGLDEQTVRRLCDEARQSGEVLGPANFNCPGQIVVSGSRSACERIVPLVEQAGGRAVPLRVAGAFHSELMKPAAEKLAGLLEEVGFRPPRMPVLSNVTGGYHGSDPQGIKDLLVRQVTSPVMWEANVRRLLADGFDQFVEVRPGRVLTGLLRKIDRKASSLNISAFSRLTAMVSDAGKQDAAG